MKGAVHLCSFSVGLEGLTRKTKSLRRVMEILAKSGRFSCWEAENVSSYLTEIKRAGLATFDTESVGYPWTKVTITDAGRAYLDGGAP